MILLLALGVVAYSAGVGASAGLFQRHQCGAKKAHWNKALAWPVTLPAFFGHRAGCGRCLPVARTHRLSRGRK